MNTFTIDMSRPSERAVFLREFEQLRGLHTITVKKNLKLRSHPQLRLYFGIYIHAFKMFLAEQGEPHTENYCHQLLARRFLSQSVINHDTGEIIGEVSRSLSDMGDVSVEEMTAYLRNVHQFLQGLGVRIPSQEEFEGTVAA